MSISIQKYTEKAIVIRGNTIPIKEKIKVLGGKFGYFGSVAGWMFPLTMEAKVREALGIRGPYVDGPSPSPSTMTAFDAPKAYTIPGVGSASEVAKGSMVGSASKPSLFMDNIDMSNVVRVSGTSKGLRDKTTSTEDLENEEKVFARPADQGIDAIKKEVEQSLSTVLIGFKNAILSEILKEMKTLNDKVDTLTKIVQERETK